MAGQLHSVLRVRQSGSIVQLQPFKGQDLAGDALSIDLSTGSIRLKNEVGPSLSESNARVGSECKHIGMYTGSITARMGCISSTSWCSTKGRKQALCVAALQLYTP